MKEQTRFVPYEKLSKKERRRLDSLRRGTWGSFNPVTRKPAKPNAYDRQKARRWSDNSIDVLFSCFL